MAIEYREERLHKLASRMAKIDTHPDLVTIVLYGVRNINVNVLLDVNRHPEETCLGGLIWEQKKFDGFSFYGVSFKKLERSPRKIPA